MRRNREEMYDNMEAHVAAHNSNLDLVAAGVGTGATSVDHRNVTFTVPSSKPFSVRGNDAALAFDGIRDGRGLTLAPVEKPTRLTQVYANRRLFGRTALVGAVEMMANRHYALFGNGVTVTAEHSGYRVQVPGRPSRFASTGAQAEAYLRGVAAGAKMP
jgi:hypothetical protein